MNAPAAWPEGVIARHLTLAGAALADRAITVDVQAEGFEAICRGCQRDHSNSYAFVVTQWAEEHAETCRALPRPHGGAA